MSQKIMMRNDQSKAGLKSMIDYIDTITPVQFLSMAEIGVYEGDGTAIFANRFKRVIAIDPWISGIGDITNTVDMDTVFERFEAVSVKFPNIETVRNYSQVAASSVLAESLGVVYIDGGHEYQDVYDDILAWKSKIKPGGWICGHDHRKKFPGVIRAVYELLGGPDKVFPDTSWVRRVRK